MFCVGISKRYEFEVSSGLERSDLSSVLSKSSIDSGEFSMLMSIDVSPRVGTGLKRLEYSMLNSHNL